MITFQPSNFAILMVDDNPKNLQLLGTTLRNEGFQIEFATNGKTALSWISKKIFDLVLLDIMMPEMSGFEVCQQIRNQANYKDVPIIFLTAKTEKESIIQGFKLGAQDYITKPFDTAELLARVRTQLELRYNRLELFKINQHLEELVKERTLELEQANKKLAKLNEEILKLDKAKSEFLHIIAHEIRTPLNGIKGSVDIMRELNENSAFNSLFNILEESVCRLEKFSLLALKITQLQTGKYELDIQEITLKYVINNILKKYSSAIHKKNINVQLKIDENLTVMADWELFNNCLSSIIDNAIKFSPNSSNIFIISEKNNQHIIIQVIDEGPGFSEKALQNLYKFFCPGERHINENEGIDLAMAKLIMDAHNGNIQVENHNLKGAKVTLSLPIKI